MLKRNDDTQEQHVIIAGLVFFFVLAKCSRGKEYENETELNGALKMYNKYIRELEWVSKKVNQKWFCIILRILKGGSEDFILFSNGVVSVPSYLHLTVLSDNTL